MVQRVSEALNGHRPIVIKGALLSAVLLPCIAWAWGLSTEVRVQSQLILANATRASTNAQELKEIAQTRSALREFLAAHTEHEKFEAERWAEVQRRLAAIEARLP